MKPRDVIERCCADNGEELEFHERLRVLEELCLASTLDSGKRITDALDLREWLTQLADAAEEIAA